MVDDITKIEGKPYWVRSRRLSLASSFFTLIPTHLCALIGILVVPFSWGLLLFGLLSFLILGSIQLLVFHRGYSHHSFSFRNQTIQRIFTFLGSMTGMSGPIWWASLHRLHHRYSDTDKDPHNSTQGFWWSHFLWVFYFDPRWGFKGTRDGKYYSFAPDVARDPFNQFLDKYYFVFFYLWWLILFLIGGLPLMVYGGCLMALLVFHANWFINSACHRWGYRSFHPHDNSTNNPWALICLGENFHNNHHAFPFSAKHGFFRWWEVDFNFLILLFLKKMGLVKQLQLPSEKQIKTPLREYEPESVSN